MIWQTNDHRLARHATDAWYRLFATRSAGRRANGDARAEFDLDCMVLLQSVPVSGPYSGLSLRQRYGDRTQPFAPFEFKSSRTQLEYTF